MEKDRSSSEELIDMRCSSPSLAPSTILREAKC